MKLTNWILALFAISATGLVGCKKDSVPQTQQVEGTSVDMPKLQQAFATSNDQLKTLVTQVAYGLRYADYEKALIALDQLANSPDATAEQKTIVTNVIDQVKKLATPAQAPAQ